LCGTVTKAYKVSSNQEFVLRSAQPILSIRPGDELVWEKDHRFRVVVLANVRQGAITEITLRVIKGMRCIGFPEIGQVMEFLLNVPDWDRLPRARKKLSVRLAV